MYFIVLVVQPILVYLRCFVRLYEPVRNGQMDARATVLLGCEIIKWLDIVDVEIVD